MYVRNRTLASPIYIYIYIYMCVCVCVLVVYIIRHTEHRTVNSNWSFLQGTESRVPTFHTKTCVMMSHQSLSRQTKTKSESPIDVEFESSVCVCVCVCVCLQPEQVSAVVETAVSSTGLSTIENDQNIEKTGTALKQIASGSRISGSYSGL